MVAALLIRLLYLMEQTGSPFFQALSLDEQELTLTARRLSNGLGFEAIPFFKAPLYAVFLSLFMRASAQWMWWTRLVQHVLGAGLVYFACDAAHRMARDRYAGLSVALTGAALTLYGPLIRLEGCLVLDTLFVFLQAGMLWCLLRTVFAGRFRGLCLGLLGGGILAALSVLTRPTVLPVLPFLAVALLWIRRKQFAVWKKLSALCFLFVLPPLLAVGWMGARNHAVSGEWIFMPWQGGYNFYEANRTGATGRYLIQHELSSNHAGNPTMDVMLAGYVAAEHPAKDQFRFSAVNRCWMQRAWRDIRENPARWGRLLFWKSIWLVSEREIYNYEEYRLQRQLSLMLRLAGVGFGLIWPFALASLAALPLPGPKRSAHLFLWMYVLLLGGCIALFFVSGRFRAPLVFPVVLLGAAGCSRLGSIALWRRVLFAVLLAAGFALSWMDWGGVRSERLEQHEYARFSQMLWQQGEYESAWEYAVLCGQENPGYPTLGLLKGQAAFSLNRYGDALAFFREAHQKLQGEVTAPYNIGMIYYLIEHDLEAAEQWWTDALQRDAGFRKAAWMLARAALCRNDGQRSRALLDHSAPRKNEWPREYMISSYCLARATRDGQSVFWRRALEERYGEAAADEAENAWQMIVNYQNEMLRAPAK